MGTARKKKGKETDEEGKQRGVSMERSKAGTKEKRSPDGLHCPNQNAIIISSSRICLIALRFQLLIAFTERKKKVPFSIAIGNRELMNECFPKHLRMGTARMK